ncbi:two-component sensor histidine kinase [Streptomyces spinoverrucosus]|uniref:histidine kinase n=1 Tax=Streptomyces spinoverrucosus TaxID=284043 RepID=A0A4Y3VSJ9_9ACTN|nr:HAMP domain-containing sensor histidine kinase [Streptomyces spinoverrucosus]GEC09817.1 two-component sensor histidine kinase [Streptomyces spinoverrucosus]GHB96957.1 two-component sensor histidine kinase [Streptomyces spinoverrucosus]
MKTRCRQRRRLTIRTRLSLTYGALFALTGAVMLAMVYVFMKYGPTYELPDNVAVTLRSPEHSVTSPQASGTGSGQAKPTASGLTSISIDSKKELLNTLLLFSALALVLLVLAAVLLGWWLAGRALAPVHNITRTARSVAAGDLDRRIALSGPHDEIKELADTFDAMLQRLHTAFRAEQHFAANASHELRTPLATTRTMLQVAIADPDHHDIRTLGPKLLETNQRSIEITEALLTLSQADHGTLDEQHVDLADVVRAVLGPADQQAGQAGVRLSARLAPAPLLGDEVLLRHMASNVIDNAIRHNHPRGTVDITLMSPETDGLRFIVRNTGPRLTAEQVARAAEPFQRLQPRTATAAGRPAGHGLGLALVHSIARAHDGNVHGRANPEGGLTIEITLPRHRGRSGGDGQLLHDRRLVLGGDR